MGYTIIKPGADDRVDAEHHYDDGAFPPAIILEQTAA
jgi:hypothetical protein